MAIYRCEAKIISRSQGHSAVAAAAYRTGMKLHDDRANITHDYSRRTKGVVESVILRPDHAPEWSAQTTTLWNEVERSEKRKDAQLCREFILALPRELSHEQQLACAVSWAQRELVGKGMIAEVSLHQSKDRQNPHAHILCTLRTIEGERFSAKKPREWNDKAVLLHWRESWAGAVNAALEQAGRAERVDHRSLQERGIDRLPEPKIGKEAMGLLKRGVVSDPERCKLVRWVRSLNFVRPWLKAIERSGEVPQSGLGRTWWERSLLLASNARQAVSETVLDAWQRLLSSRRPAGPDVPPPDRGPELER